MGEFLETVKVPDRAIAWVYLFSENSISEVSSHWHPNIELTLICRGQALYTINGRPLTPRQGNLVLINSGDLHNCSIDLAACEGITIMFPNDYFTQFEKGEDAILFKLDETNENYPRLTEKCKELYRIFSERKQDPYAQLRLNSLICEIAYLLLAHFRWDEFTPLSIKSEKYRKRCRDIMDYVDSHFRKDISMKTLMNKFNISKEHLARIFRVYMGTTFKKYLSRLRIYYAYKLLTNSDLTLTHIAMDCGFPDSRTFISIFRRAYGATPGKYRLDFYQNVQKDLNEATKPTLFFPIEERAGKVY